MTTYEDDQCKSTTMVINGAHAAVNAAQLKAASAAGSVYTFTVGFQHVYKGQHLQFRKGMSYILDAQLKAQLLALGAPMVAA